MRWRGARGALEPAAMRFLDSSVILASLHEAEPHHDACNTLLLQGGHALYAHALAEVFSTLTGGTQGLRIGADLAHRLLRDVQAVTLDADEMMSALAHARARGVRGGAVYDYLHLVAARKAGAEALVTLDVKHFAALTRQGDPRVESV